MMHAVGEGFTSEFFRVLSGLTVSPWSHFQHPPYHTQRVDFLVYTLLAPFISRMMGAYQAGAAFPDGRYVTR
jgi:hypothetical protein